jgi:hypothetical protein
MAYVWGADGTRNTPLFARIGKEVLWPPYEKGQTLIEAEHMVASSVWPEYHSEYHSPLGRFTSEKPNPRKSLNSRGMKLEAGVGIEPTIGVLQADPDVF